MSSCAVQDNNNDPLDRHIYALQAVHEMLEEEGITYDQETTRYVDNAGNSLELDV